MVQNDKAFIGIIGMAVMGRSLALNIVDHGFSVVVWNRNQQVMDEAVEQSGGRLEGTTSLAALIGRLERPRRVMLMIQAGPPVDAVLDQLVPLLEPGDLVIDGGNSWFEDTRRREGELAQKGLRFFGVGVSGGEEGARFGPSLMPGGDRQAYSLLEPMFRAIAAETEAGPCVTHVGPDGAGHFVKMVHNGIEYADMQLIAEAYHLLRALGGLAPPALAEVFAQWNRGDLKSFLVEISAAVFAKSDGDGWLVDRVLDKAGQKGTGRWTVQVALDLAVPVPSIAAAIDARVISNGKDARLAAQEILPGPSAAVAGLPPDELVSLAHDALWASKVVAYSQGLALIRAASDRHDWSVNLSELARIWKGGCIIRAALLDDIRRVYGDQPELPNLLLAGELRDRLFQVQSRWRSLVARGQEQGLPLPAMSASLAYYDSLRAGWLPHNLTQAQRDAFGAHTYQRNDEPHAPFVHSEWFK